MEGCILGPLDKAANSRFGVIPKGRDTGRWRLIKDDSFSDCASVNDGINSSLCTLQYTSVEREKVAREAHRMGSRTLLANADIKLAYRLVPVHPDDRHMERGMLCGHQVAVQPTFITRGFHSSGRCPGMVHPYSPGSPGHRQLPQ